MLWDRTGKGWGPGHAARTFFFLTLSLAGPAAGQVELISRAPARFAPDTGDGSLTAVALSADGRYAAFSSTAANLVPGQQDSNLWNDIFLYDRLAGTTTLVSHAAESPALTATRGSDQPALSADGRFVAFVSSAWDLVPGVGAPDAFGYHVYLWDRETGEVTAVTRRAGTEEGAGGHSRDPVLSADGSYLAFVSSAPDLIPGQVQGSSGDNVFLYERATGTLRLVSHSAASATRAGEGSAQTPSLSADGRFVAYGSTATDLVAGQTDANGEFADLFLYDRQTGANVLVSHAAGSALTTSNAASQSPRLSADGQLVVFESLGTNLVSGVDDNGVSDVFLYDRLLGTVTLLSLPSLSAGYEAGGREPRISGDGRTVAFLLAGVPYLFTVDRLTGVRAPVTASAGAFSLSDDGRRVAFESDDNSQAPGQVDDNQENDVFLYDRATGATTLVSHTASDPAKAGDQASTRPVLSADGRWLAYGSLATDLVAGLRHGDSSLDLHLYDAAAAENRVATLHPPGMASVTAWGEADTPSVSADGRYVTFSSYGDRLVPTQVDRNRASDVFLYDRVTRKTILVSRSATSARTAGNAHSTSPRISRNGAWILFQSHATDLVPGQQDSPGTLDVFLYERRTGAVTLVSHSRASHLRAARGDSRGEALSADGRFVVFTSLATDLVPRQRDSRFTQDLFVYDRRTGAVTLVTRTPATGAAWTGNGSSHFSSMSPDGAFIAFDSAATNLVPGVPDTNGLFDAFLWQRSTGQITLLSRTRGIAGPASGGASPLVSGNGRWVAFLDLDPSTSPHSGPVASLKILDRATRTVREAVPHGEAGDLLGLSDDGRWLLWSSPPDSPVSRLFLLDRVTGEARQVGPDYTFSGRLSADGRRVAFSSASQELLPDQPSPPINVFVYDRTTEEITVASRSAFHPTYGGNQDSYLEGIGPGGHVLFLSYATDLVPRDCNGSRDLFLYTPEE
ncbi:MAG TPA: hypothetical protein VLQ45_15895 [Thermoanaerobaculia bacterium]|nr:hypothetical protein [Thermoanaerobaculia bacterium]